MIIKQLAVLLLKMSDEHTKTYVWYYPCHDVEITATCNRFSNTAALTEEAKRLYLPACKDKQACSITTVRHGLISAVNYAKFNGYYEDIIKYVVFSYNSETGV